MFDNFTDIYLSNPIWPIESSLYSYWAYLQMDLNIQVTANTWHENISIVETVEFNLSLIWHHQIYTFFLHIELRYILNVIIQRRTQFMIFPKKFFE